MAIGGGWPGNPDATTPFPDTMYVDYVRVYQLAAAVLKTVTMVPIISLFYRTILIRLTHHKYYI